MLRPIRKLAMLAAFVLLLCSPAMAQKAFPLSLQDPLTGERLDVAAGAPALHLVFFATWCPPCVKELESLTLLNARWEEQGYRLVLVAVQTRHTAERLTRFVATHGTPGRMLYDVDGLVAESLGADQLPTHLVFDAAGNEILRDSSLGADVGAAVRRLIAEARLRGS